MSRIESTIAIGSGIAGFLALPVYAASQLDWASHPYRSAILMALTLPVDLAGGVLGFLAGTNIADSLMTSRNEREQKRMYKEMENKGKEVERTNLSKLEK